VNQTKAEWRGWAWNYVANNVRATTKLAKVLYLPGDTDADMRAAVKRGFHIDNLYAVDCSKAAVKANRSQTVNVIHSDLKSAMLAILENQDLRFDAVIIDYCCGLTKASIETSFLAEECAKEKSPVVLNFQRGRDDFNDNTKRKEGLSLDEKNRSRMYWKIRKQETEAATQSFIAVDPEKWSRGPFKKMWASMFKGKSPVHKSYRANRVWMDSVAFCTGLSSEWLGCYLRQQRAHLILNKSKQMSANAKQDLVNAESAFYDFLTTGITDRDLAEPLKAHKHTSLKSIPLDVDAAFNLEPEGSPSGQKRHKKTKQKIAAAKAVRSRRIANN